MSGKSRAVSKRSTRKAKWKGFVNIRLETSASLETLWDLFDESDIESVIELLIDAGYKVSITKDFDSGARIVAVTGDKEFCKDAGYSSSSFASTVEGGILACAWKAFYYNGGNPWEMDTGKSDFEI